MDWDKIGLLFSLSRYKTDVNISTSTDCYLVTGSIGDILGFTLICCDPLSKSGSSKRSPDKAVWGGIYDPVDNP